MIYLKQVIEEGSDQLESKNTKHQTAGSEKSKRSLCASRSAYSAPSIAGRNHEGRGPNEPLHDLDQFTIKYFEVVFRKPMSCPMCAVVGVFRGHQVVGRLANGP